MLNEPQYMSLGERQLTLLELYLLFLFALQLKTSYSQQHVYKFPQMPADFSTW